MKIFLSSTAEDLDAYRNVAEETILQLTQQIVAMEYFGALPGTPVEECERLARESDVLVCIVAHRYGSGITRLEVEAAHKANKDVLVWIVADDYSWSGNKETDTLADPNVFSNAAKTENVRRAVEALSNFKAWLRKTFTTSTFTTADDLGRKIAVALTNYVKGHAVPAIPQDRISIARLPVTGAELFGREAELQLLDDAWESTKTNIVSFVAWGGVGKTALVNHWLKRRMARDNYRGAERVSGWSFFSQGTSERAASADLFIDWALRWFGDSDPTSGNPWDKGERLARYIRRSRTLLILDGLEPLQHPPGPHEGCLKDAALQALLVELAAHQPGLCVISTRERIGDLVEFEDGTIIQHDLDHLSALGGAQILRSFGVKGDDHDLEETASELSGHAFSLTLLGSYLNEALGGDIQRRNEIEDLFADTRYGGAVQRMIAAYEKWLGEGIELAILRLLGLFDRPVDLASIIALREPPTIPDLTEPLQNLKGREWNQAVAKLRRIKLLAEPSLYEPGTIDAHPLLREYFKQELKRDRVEAWRAGNYRLYEHLKNTTKEFPETVEEMLPLYAAVVHGCSAGIYEDALKNVYKHRIQRGDFFFNTSTLGAVGMALATLSGFFVEPWKLTVQPLEDMDKGYVLNDAGLHLSFMGRLQEAAQATKAAFEIAISKARWRHAAAAAGNLGATYLIIGDIQNAVYFAQQGVELADRSEGSLERASTRATLGNVLHHFGESESAGIVFREGEEIFRVISPGLPLFYSAAGFYYCDWLLSQGESEKVKARAAQTFLWAREGLGPLATALDHLSLGRVSLLELQQANIGSNHQAVEHLQKAVELLRHVGMLRHLPPALLARAGLHRFTRDFESAEHDLQEVHRIATRSAMSLYLADYYLESSRLSLAQENEDTAREHLATAKEMITRMGYHRRDKEVAELEAQLA